MIAEGLFAHLTADTAVTSLVGLRVYPHVIPQRIPGQAGKIPAVTYEFSGLQVQTRYCGTDPHGRRTLRIDCFAVDYPGARAVATAIRGSLLDFSGLLGGLVSVHAIMLADEFETVDLEPGLYRVSQSWHVWIVE